MTAAFLQTVLQGNRFVAAFIEFLAVITDVTMAGWFAPFGKEEHVPVI